MGALTLLTREEEKFAKMTFLSKVNILQTEATTTEEKDLEKTVYLRDDRDKFFRCLSSSNNEMNVNVSIRRPD